VKVGLIQSNFIPWRGYFDFIDDVDLFIYYDDIQFSKGTFRNRNKIKTEKGLVWVTVPILHKSLGQLICDTYIDYSKDWIQKITGQLHNYYRRVPYYKVYADDFFAILNNRNKTISELNINVNNWIMAILGIKTKIKMSSEFNSVGTKTDRILGILQKVGADSYLSGPSAKSYLEEDKFAKCGIALEYKSYEYKEYSQLFGKFEPNVTILDMLFNVGAQSSEYWKSIKPNEKEIYG